MVRTHPNQEVEIKLRVTDVSALRRRLKQLKARKIGPRTHEFNTLYDTPKKDLARRGQLVRIRIERQSLGTGRKGGLRSDKAVLTYKGPAQAARGVQSAAGKLGIKGRYKIREEVEVAVSDGEHMRRILSALGLRPLFRYEKFRTTYALRRGENLKIEFDETPIGIFLELEGSRSAIDRVASRLGYTRSDYITQTYGALYIAHCRRRGYKPADMLFPSTK